MRSESKARFRRPRRVEVVSVQSNFLPSSAVSQFPTRTPSRLTPFTRRMPAARSGLRSPQSDASYASRRIAANLRLIVDGAYGRCPTAIRYRVTTVLLKASLGSEQYQSMNSQMAWSYERFELEDVRLFKTADFDCSRSGNLRTVFGTRLRLLFAIGSGLRCRGEKHDPVTDLLTSSAFLSNDPGLQRPNFWTPRLAVVLLAHTFTVAPSPGPNTSDNGSFAPPSPFSIHSTTRFAQSNPGGTIEIIPSGSSWVASLDGSLLKRRLPAP